jgi:hypothetical protein
MPTGLPEVRPAWFFTRQIQRRHHHACPVSSGGSIPMGMASAGRPLCQVLSSTHHQPAGARQVSSGGYIPMEMRNASHGIEALILTKRKSKMEAEIVKKTEGN